MKVSWGYPLQVAIHFNRIFHGNKPSIVEKPHDYGNFGGSPVGSQHLKMMKSQNPQEIPPFEMPQSHACPGKQPFFVAKRSTDNVWHDKKSVVRLGRRVVKPPEKKMGESTQRSEFTPGMSEIPSGNLT